MTAVLHKASPGLDRFSSPLYTLVETARYLDVPASTLTAWTKAYPSPAGRQESVATPLLTTVTSRRRGPVVPFIGLAEGLVLVAMRHAGVPLQRIRASLTRLGDELRLEYPLASRRLSTEGAQVLADYIEHGEDSHAVRAAQELVVVRGVRSAWHEVVESSLRGLRFADDGYADLIRLPAYAGADIVVDPTRGFGQPIFARGGARVKTRWPCFKPGNRSTWSPRSAASPANNWRTRCGSRRASRPDRADRAPARAAGPLSGPPRPTAGARAPAPCGAPAAHAGRGVRRTRRRGRGR